MGQCMSCFKAETNPDITASSNRDKDGKIFFDIRYENSTLPQLCREVICSILTLQR